MTSDFLQKDLYDLMGHVVLVDTTSFNEKEKFPLHEFQKLKTQNTVMFFLEVTR